VIKSNYMSPDIKAILRIQSLDQRGAELEKEIAALPKHIAQIEKALDAHNRKLEVDRAALTANQRDRRKSEDDIKAQEQKISKLRDQMLQAKTNEQYRAFQHEIEFCEKEIRKSEDRILELMSESESLDKNVKAAEAALKEEKQQVEAEKDRARSRTATDQKFLAEVKEERAGLVSSIDPKLMQQYERISKKWKGRAVADATDGRCASCQISMRPQYFQDLKKAEKLLTCESCGRILYYNPPVNLEHEMHSVPTAR
jgi:predicted  nucleic acid-binding Zn-ribbon protein